MYTVKTTALGARQSVVDVDDLLPNVSDNETHESVTIIGQENPSNLPQYDAKNEHKNTEVSDENNATSTISDPTKGTLSTSKKLLCNDLNDQNKEESVLNKFFRDSSFFDETYDEPSNSHRKEVSDFNDLAIKTPKDNHINKQNNLD